MYLQTAPPDALTHMQTRTHARVHGPPGWDLYCFCPRVLQHHLERDQHKTGAVGRDCYRSGTGGPFRLGSRLDFGASGCELLRFGGTADTTASNWIAKTEAALLTCMPDVYIARGLGSGSLIEPVLQKNACITQAHRHVHAHTHTPMHKYSHAGQIRQ